MALDYADDNRWPCCIHCANGDGMLPCGQVHPEPCGNGACGEITDADIEAWRAGLDRQP